MNVADDIKNALSDINSVFLEVINDSDRHSGHFSSPHSGQSHFIIHIVSDVFEGKNSIARHRMIYERCNHLMPSPIHALNIRAKTPKEHMK